MPADLLVVHLVSRGVGGVRSGWDTPDGAVRHEVVSWRQSPETLSRADVVVAHGLASLVVAQAIAGTGPRIVYRPTNSTRATRRRLRRGLHADWIASRTRRSGWAAAVALGLSRQRITVFRNEDRAAWDDVVARLRQLRRSGSASETPAPPAGERSQAPPDDWSEREPGPERERERTMPGSGFNAPPAWTVPEAPRPAARLLAVGVAAPASPGHPWWMYRRMNEPASVRVEGLPPDGAGRPPSSGPPAGPGPRPMPAPDNPAGGPVQIISAPARSGVGFFFIGAAALAIVGVCTQLGPVGEGVVLVPLGGLFLTLAAARRIARRRPKEEWVARWLVLGLVAKLVAAYLNYYTVIVTYHGKGDALDYDGYGRQYAQAWLKGGTAPVLSNLKATNFVRWFTGVVYYAFGSKLLTGTFVFALLAFAGSYLWYRATADSVPFVNRKLYLGFVLFAPSILFWPAIVGKEALMQFALGVLALGVSFLLRQRLLVGLVVSGAAGWLVWVVRPHLLALVAVAAGAAYLAGRVRKEGKKAGLLSRPIGIVIIAFLVAFTIGQGAQFLGLKSLSFNSIQQELNQESATTANGKSTFHKSGNSLSPLHWPSDAVTVFLRPFPWEIQSSLQILASLESAALALLIVVRFKSLRLAFAQSRRAPFLMFCLILTLLYAIAFSSFSNFGLLVRERSLVLPALLVLLSVDPLLVRDRQELPRNASPLQESAATMRST